MRGSYARYRSSASCRGLGLLDAILAAAVLGVVTLWGAQAFGIWAQSRVVTGEVRTVAELARAGRLLLEGDVTHSARTQAVASAPLPVALSELSAANLRSPTLGNITPGRRTLSLWFYRPTTGTVLVIARARGDIPLSRLPGATDGVTGVGMLRTGDTSLRGPGIDYDIAPLNALTTGFATVNDLFAVDDVALDVACQTYLFRVAIDCDGDGVTDSIANTMTVDLDMGGHDIVGVNDITVATATIGTLSGATVITNDMDVSGDLEVGGQTDLHAVTVSGAISAESVDIDGDLTVDNLTATADITGADLTFDGTITVSGDARLGDADVNTLNVETLNVRQLSSDTAQIARGFVTTLTVTSCTGCNPAP
ncbi:MAG: hypothetical protein OXC62_15470 [Aestuariivita sp.]|nr:hypothetical protein [Aestuariivita sp.]